VKPVTLDIVVSSATPVTAWHAYIALAAGERSDAKSVLMLTAEHDGPLVGGLNRFTVGDTGHPSVFGFAGRHRVTVHVANEGGEKVQAETAIRVRGKASLSVDGVSGPLGATGKITTGRRALVWGSASQEMLGRKVTVEFKAAGTTRYAVLGTTRVRKANGYWALRSAKVGPGTIRVTADTPYIVHTTASLRVKPSDFTAKAPDLAARRYVEG
jgi:hypothetical protein